MEETNGRTLKQPGPEPVETGESLFSSLRPKPAPQTFAPPPPPPPPPPPSAAAGPAADTLNFMQQRISDLEKRLYDTQEKALMFSVELKSREEHQRSSVRQAEEVFEKLRDGQRAEEQEKKMADRLAQLESISRKLEASTLETAAGVGAAGVESSALKSTLSLVMARLAQLEGVTLKLDAGARDNAAGISAANAESGAIKSALAIITERLGGMESRLSAMETRINEVLVKGELRDKMAARDSAVNVERMDRLEKNSVPLDYVDRRLTGFEMDSAMIRKVESVMAGAAGKIEKLEGEAQALLIEQAHAAETSRAEGTALEELSAQFVNLSVIFNHLRQTGLGPKP